MAKSKKAKAAKKVKKAVRGAKQRSAPKSAASPAKKGGKGKVDKTTIKLAPNDAVKKFGDAYKRLKSDAQGVSGDMSALKTKITEAHGHFKAIKIALDIASLSDAKIAVLLPHLDQAFTVFDVYKRGNLQLEMFAANVLKDAQKAAEAAAKVKAQPSEPSTTTSLVRGPGKDRVKEAADRAEARSKNGGAKPGPAADGKVDLSDVDQIKAKLAEGAFVSQEEREKLAEFDHPSPSQSAH